MAQDRMWKLRPWLNSFKMSLQKITPEQHNSVDERQESAKAIYICGNPHPWGIIIKLWGSAGPSGILYDFEVYQGPDSIGVGGDAVLRMASGIPFGMNYLVFEDNFFTGLALIERLQQKGIQCIRTMRPNRLKGLDLKSEKQLKKRRQRFT
ncbi:PiggyBac transposable element-derived protein 4 [Plakobranchus ocellatus]|uniref:PiggyBac transposable element-derived protein 4 n=1 Tax=Plakobranchus ocellatus TaxID=259542 RepID=A0AAV3Z5A2_9GAST|nr:PiggyBac transposable element-derived protein 4 [Plakobranchus ocellatus]